MAAPSRAAAPARVPAALAGIVSAAAALGVGELLAGLVASVPSPVVAVGDAVIDNVPGDIERAAIDIFGAADKVALVSGIVIVSLLLGAALGVAARRRIAAGVVGFAAFGVLGVAAATQVEGASAVLSALVLAIAVAAASVVLRSALLVAPASAPWRDAVVRPGPGHGNRRAFLRQTGIVAAGAGAAALLGRQLASRSNVAVERAAVVLPRVAGPAIPAGADLDVPGLTPFITPNDEFYRIDTALRLPQVDPASWRLRVEGLVDEPFELRYDELLAMPQEEHLITMACVSNEVGGDLVGNALWQGVSLPRLLRRAGVQPEGTQVVGRSVDGFTVGFPTEAALDGREALVAVGMNGAPLPVRHGFPARLVVAGLYGYVSATKWLDSIELVPWDAFDAYWVPRGWSKLGPVKTQSRIDVPSSGATVGSGRVAVAGVAWAPTRGIDEVQVRVDDGPWREAELAAAVTSDSWRQWLWRWDAEPGRHTLTVRAAEGSGALQTAERTDVAPDGASGYHSIRVTVR